MTSGRQSSNAASAPALNRFAAIDAFIGRNAFEKLHRREANLAPADGRSAQAANQLEQDLFLLINAWADPAYCQPPTPREASLLASALGPLGFADLTKRWGADPASLCAALKTSHEDARWEGVATILSHPQFNPALAQPAASARMVADLISDSGHAANLSARAALSVAFKLPVDLAWTDADGLTLLGVVARAGNIVWTKILLAKGADPRALDGQGTTPTQLAMKRFADARRIENQAVARALLEAGGGDDICRSMAVGAGDAVLAALTPCEDASWWLSSQLGQSPLWRLMMGMIPEVARADVDQAAALGSIAHSIASLPESHLPLAAMELARALGAAEATGFSLLAEALRRQVLVAFDRAQTSLAAGAGSSAQAPSPRL